MAVFENLITGLRDVHEHVHAIEPRKLIHTTCEGEVFTKVTVPLLTKLDDSIDLLTELESLAREQSSVHKQEIPSDLCDSCSLARNELQQLRTRLEQLKSINSSELLASSECIIGRIRHALGLVLETLDSGYRTQAKQRASLELKNSKNVRSLYDQLCRLVDHKPKDAFALLDLLGSVAQIVDLMGQDTVGLRVRLDDLTTLLAIRGRIRAYRRAQLSETVGWTIYQDLKAMTHLLQKINDRQILQDEDRRSIEHALHLLNNHSSEAVCRYAVGQLYEVRGRDRVLDDLVAQTIAGAWNDSLKQRILDRLQELHPLLRPGFH